MEGNMNKPTDNFRSAMGISGTGNESQPTSTAPITAQPSQFFRSSTQMGNCGHTSFRNNFTGARPFFNCAATYGQNIRPWMKVSHNSDQNSRSNSSDNVVINFDNISEPSTSQYSTQQHSMQNLYESYTNKKLPEFQNSATSLEIVQSSDPQNRSETIRETSIDINHQNNGFVNQNNNNNNNNSNSHSNNLILQNSEGTHENPSLNPNSGTFLDKMFNKYLPFLTFLSLKTAYDHRQGILIFVGLLVTFIHANSVVKREIARQSRRSFISLGIIFVNLFISICFIYFVFRDQKLYKNLIFMPPYSQPLSIWDVLWIVGITDFVLKFITIQLKVGMTCFPAKLLPYSSRGKWYLVLERTSQLYRGLVPIQPWLYYLMEVYQEPESMMGMGFSVVYVVSKGSDIMCKVKLFLKAFFKLFQNTSLGVCPSNEQLINAGSHCPICHDEYNFPIILQCKHIFCESCVTTWFDREQTCPLCRAKIADDPSWRDGATSLFTQLY